MAKHIDIAVNLLSGSLIEQRQDIITQAAKHHVSPLIVIGSELEESEQSIKVCLEFPDKLYCTVGVHPHYASQWNSESKTQLVTLAKQPYVVAIGECGLDYNRDFSPRDKQREAFRAQLEIACELQLPVYMHCRDAHDDFIAIVKEYRSRLKTAVLHCFTGTKDELMACLAEDLYIGITGWICDERRGQALADIVKYIPDNRILAETDAPYLLPRSMRPKPKSSKNLPEYLPYIVEVMAELRSQSYETLAAHCYQNSLDVFNLPPQPLTKGTC